MQSRAFLVGIALAALVGSLALNGYFLFLGPRRSVLATTPPRLSPRQPRPHLPTAAETPTAPGTTCQQQLDVCRRAGWRLLGQVIRGKFPGARPAPGKPAHPPPTTVPRGESGAEAQAQARCDAAQENLRRAWKGKIDATTKFLRTSLGNEQEQQQNGERELGQLAKTLDLGRADQERIDARYLALRRQAVTEALGALQGEPPDHAGVLEAAKRWFRDQDRLVRDTFGDAAVTRWRKAQLRTRSMMMALLATHAGRTWDDPSLVW